MIYKRGIKLTSQITQSCNMQVYKVIDPDATFHTRDDDPPEEQGRATGGAGV